MVNVKLYTHEMETPYSDDPNGPPVKHALIDLSVPESVAHGLVRLFFENPEGDTSVHGDTLALFPC